jgi:xylulokinase
LQSSADLVVSADFGTSAVKVGVVDRNLNILARAVETYPLDLDAGGHAEQAPQDLWAALARALRTLGHEIPNLKERTGVLVFCSQICGVICADENGTPLRPCLTWLDKRAAPLGRELIGGFPEVLGYKLTKLQRWLRLANGAPAKNGMDPTTKLLWLMQNEPETVARTRWFLDVKDWLVHCATGVFTTCPESANLTWLMDTRPGREGWSPALAKMTGIPLDKMPKITSGTEVVGHLTARAAAELGLGDQVQVLGGTSDVTAAALGSGEVEDGALHISVATSAWVSGFFPSRRLNVPHSYATIASSVDYRPLLVASQENAGSALEWAVRVTGGLESTENLADAYQNIGAPRADDPYFLPWLAGERVPVDDDALRGAFHGLSLHHGPNDIRRAALEGVVLNLSWAYDIVSREKGVRTDGPLSLVGGVAMNPVFGQMLADSLNRDIRVGEARYAGLLGAATLAAPTMGWTDTVLAAAAQLKTKTHATYKPDPARVIAVAARKARLAKIRKHILRSYR